MTYLLSVYTFIVIVIFPHCINLGYFSLNYYPLSIRKIIGMVLSEHGEI